jgi:hypothetical protein
VYENGFEEVASLLLDHGAEMELENLVSVEFHSLESSIPIAWAYSAPSCLLA